MCGRWMGGVGFGGFGGERGRGGIGGRGRRHRKDLHVACTIGCGIIMGAFANGDFSRWRRFGVYHMEKSWIWDMGGMFLM